MKNLRKLIARTTIVVVLLVMLVPQVASAAAITSVKDVLSTNKVGVDADHTISFVTPTGVAAAETITVTFPAGFDLATNSVAFGDMDLSGSTAGEQTLAAVPDGATWGAAVSGQVVTFTSATGTIDAAETITIEIGTNAASGVNQITNHSSAGSYIIAIGGTMVDSGSMAIALVTDPQVDISANVDETLTLALSSTTVAFGTLSSSSAASDTMTLTVNTNAGSGYNLTYEATDLQHTNASDTIAAYAGAASSPGTEGWGVNLKDNATPNVGAEPASTAGSGTPTPAGDYNTADSFKLVTGSTNTAFASAAGTAQDDVYTVSYVANIAAITEAGDYTGTVDYIIYATF